jgi:alkaline phosphatase D
MKSLFLLAVPLNFFFVLSAQAQLSDELKPFFNPVFKPFYFGVASGDPHPDKIVIWTKIIPESEGTQEVYWQLATDTFMQDVLWQGVSKTDVTSAYTVKIDIAGLEPGRYYYYRFQHEGTWSQVGRTKTAPAGEVGKVVFAVVSCSDFTLGHFNAYGDIARRNDLDLVIHLGDYIYEYGNSSSARGRIQRARIRRHIPDNELITMEDYRTRYGQYRLDPQLMEAHRLHPFIVVWDDHEFANDSYTGGAQNHQTSDGDWQARAHTARQVYFEWLPVRETPNRSIVRDFTFGNLAGLWMLDSRQENRTKPAAGQNDPSWQAESRHMIGDSQTQWLLDGIASSEAKWKVIGNQVIFSPLNDSKVFDRTPSRKMDRWDGYPAERNRIMDFFYSHKLDNIIVVTGDVHTSWAFELTKSTTPDVYDAKNGAGVVGAEFITPSISAFNFDEVVPGILSLEAKRRFLKKKNNPHLRFLDLNRHGYMTLTLTQDRARADWFFVKTLSEVSDKVKAKTHREILNGGRKVSN